MPNVSLSLVAVVATIVLVTIIQFTLRRRARPVCPVCGSREVGREKIFEDMQTVDYHSGGASGGSTAIQMKYRVKYQCNDCRHHGLRPKRKRGRLGSR